MELRGALESFFCQVEGGLLTIAITDGSSFYAGNFSVSANTFYRALGAFNSSDGKLRVYKDGVLQSTSLAIVGVLKAGVDFTFGRAGGLTTFYFDGTIASAVIYGEYLDATDALADFNGTFTPSATLKGKWQMNGGSGVTASDASSGGNDGTLTGGASWTTDVYSPVDEAITWQAATMFKYLTTSLRSFRYWRLLITGDSTNSDGWLDVAEVYLGGYFEPAYNYDFGNVLGEQSFEETRETESKAEKTVLLNRGRTAILPYRHVTAAEKDSFLSMFRAVKDTVAERNKPLFVHLNVDDGESLLFAAMCGPFSPNEEGPDDFSFELELRERLA